MTSSINRLFICARFYAMACRKASKLGSDLKAKATSAPSKPASLGRLSFRERINRRALMNSDEPAENAAILWAIVWRNLWRRASTRWHLRKHLCEIFLFKALKSCFKSPCRSKRSLDKYLVQASSKLRLSCDCPFSMPWNISMG